MTTIRLQWTQTLPQRPGYYLLVEHPPLPRKRKGLKPYTPPTRIHAGLVVDCTAERNNDYWTKEGFRWFGAGKTILGWDTGSLTLSPATRQLISGKAVNQAGSSVRRKRAPQSQLWFARVPGIPERK